MPIIDHLDKDYFEDKKIEERRLERLERKEKCLEYLGITREDLNELKEFKKEKILANTIDYEGLQFIAERSEFSKATVTRLAHYFSAQNIQTYSDLVKQTEASKPHRKRFGVRDLKLRGLGLRSYQLLYKHLNRKGIEIFSGGYTPKELGKN